MIATLYEGPASDGRGLPGMEQLSDLGGVLPVQYECKVDVQATASAAAPFVSTAGGAAAATAVTTYCYFCSWDRDG